MMSMLYGITGLFHKDGNNLLDFIMPRHITIYLIYEPILNTDLPQEMSHVFKTE